MTCPRCRTANVPGATECLSCGFGLARAAPSEPRGKRRGLAIAALVLGILDLPTLGLFLIGAVAGIILGVTALVKANREPSVYGGKGFALAGIICSALSVVLIPFVGILAAIAIPSLLRARVSANEAMAIRDIRSVIEAEASYQSSNGGFFGALECLSAPSSCKANYQGSTFLEPALARTGLKGGYLRSFHPGPASAASGVARSSLRAWAYVALPAERGRTGVRAFCGDATGRICYTAQGTMPTVVDGVCPAGCEDLQ
jgi:type IV pilus assembly protein PilA